MAHNCIHRITLATVEIVCDLCHYTDEKNVLVVVAL
jgi:hypothetical protein